MPPGAHAPFALPFTAATEVAAVHEFTFKSISCKADDIRTYVSANNTDDIRTYKSADIIQRYPHLCSSTENVWTQD